MATFKAIGGATAYPYFVIVDSAGDAINLTGGTIKFKIAKNVNVADGSALYYGAYTSFTNAVGGIHLEAIPASTTSDWTAGQYKFQSQFIDASGVVITEEIDTCIISEPLIDNA